MRKSIALKTLLRAPVKTLLTFLLITAASFALFSRVTDYAVTTREAAKAESFYSGVAALDNSVPDVFVDQEVDGIMWGTMVEMDDKPWPTDEQIEEFSSLPGVTLADTRYMTAGRIGDYKRLRDKDDSTDIETFILEGTYDGYEEAAEEGYATLNFKDVTVHAGEIKVNPENPTRVKAVVTEELMYGKNPYPLSFFEQLEKGSRCLVVGSRILGTLEMDHGLDGDAFRVIDGLGDGYLETEDFAFYKGQIEAFQQSLFTYDIVYTADTRAIPRFNERKMVINQGRPLTAEDTAGCVVSADFLEKYGLSLGDELSIELGDKLFHQNYLSGAAPGSEKEISNFVDTAELEIIGTYKFTDSFDNRCYSEREWSYTPNTVFVPSALLPVEVPDDYEIARGEFSVFIENAHDIKAFQRAAEPLVEEMDVGLNFSDGGWTSMKDNFETGSLASLLTTVLYVLGAALALFLAVYLYIGRNQKSYAIMRTLGVSGKKAGNSVALPLLFVSVFAMPIGGITGLVYASYTAAQTLADMSNGNAPKGYAYVLDATLPVGVIILCLVFELGFLSLAALLFLRNMKKTPPLELLQEGVLRAGMGTKVRQELLVSDVACVPAGLDMEKLSVADKGALRGNYGAVRQVSAYILRHMRRGIGKTAVSFVLAAVLTAGIGTFALARLAYQDAYQEVEVGGKAWDFASTSVTELSKSYLVEDFYYYNNNFSVYVNGTEFASPVAVTNDFDRYLDSDYKVTYGKGYGLSDFEGTDAVCLVGRELADVLGVEPGEVINLMSEGTYSFMLELYEGKGEEERQEAIRQAGKLFTVAGIVESENENDNSSIFAAANEETERLYGQPYPVSYCEFTLADNERLSELNVLLDDLQRKGMSHSPMGSFHVDSEAFENIRRVRGLLESLFPIAVAAAALIGLFGPGLVILQSAQEAAFLRVLGVTKKRTRCMLVFEQIVLCSVATAVVAGMLATFRPGLFARSTETLAFCWILYIVGCILGAFAASVQVTRHKVLELLQVKE